MMEAANDELTRQLLIWISRGPRSYDQAMEAWRTTCPRMPIWENAISSGLIQVRRDEPGPAMVSLTPRGRAMLASATTPT